jgi:glucose/arabinose dehydrogenase
VRGITFAPNGDLIAVTTDGEIRRYRDVDHDGLFAEGAPETIVWAKAGGDDGHNCHLERQDLYCGSKSGVKRWRYAPESDQGGPGEDVIVGMPEGGRHPRHPVAVWDGFVYAVSGSADNSMSPMPPDYDTSRNIVKRFPLDRYAPAKPFQWKDGEIVVRGTRNVTAMARHPRSGRIIGIDNSLDDVAHGGVDIHEDNPGEAVVTLEPGKAYGYPFCFFAQRVVENGVVVPPGTPLASEVKANTPVIKEIAKNLKSTRDDAWCAANVARPMSVLQAHSSALSMAFPGPGAQLALAEKWRSGAFVALHGSWDRAISTGNKVIWMPFDAQGNTPMPTSTKDSTSFPYEVVFGGGKYGAPRDGEWSWKIGDAGEDPVRPVGVAISPVDGALFVSSDNSSGPTSAKNGSIYRIALLGK